VNIFHCRWCRSLLGEPVFDICDCKTVVDKDFYFVIFFLFFTVYPTTTMNVKDQWIFRFSIRLIQIQFSQPSVYVFVYDVFGELYTFI